MNTDILESIEYYTHKYQPIMSEDSASYDEGAELERGTKDISNY